MRRLNRWDCCYVNYTVRGRDYQAGPYDEFDAEWNRMDIAGYEGVTRVYLSWHRDPARTLSGATPMHASPRGVQR